MSYSLIKFIKRRKNRNKQRIILIILSIVGFVACQGALEDGTPFGPSTSIFKILPTNSLVTKGTDLTFSPYGGTSPYTWTSTNVLVGTIVLNTGKFTAVGTNNGTITITAVDAVGNIATASVTIPGAALVFDVANITQAVIETDDIVTVTTNGSGIGFTVTVANDVAGGAYALLPTVVSTGTTVTITSPATIPTAVEGNQAFTITVTDTQNTNTNTIAYNLTAEAA
jgi:hypothetical protein